MREREERERERERERELADGERCLGESTVEEVLRGQTMRGFIGHPNDWPFS
jgi:hypothetical protein